MGLKLCNVTPLSCSEYIKMMEGRVVEINCPDCGAILLIRSKEKLPEDIEIEFIKHQC